MKVMDWGDVADMVTFGEVSAEDADDPADVFVLLAPQNIVGNTIMTNLSDMVRLLPQEHAPPSGVATRTAELLPRQQRLRHHQPAGCGSRVRWQRPRHFCTAGQARARGPAAAPRLSQPPSAPSLPLSPARAQCGSCEAALHSRRGRWPVSDSCPSALQIRLTQQGLRRPNSSAA